MLPSCSPGFEYRISHDPHHWHDTTGTLVDYADGDRALPAGIEILQRNDKEGRWLIAWFEDGINHLFIGELNISTNPWRMHRIRSSRQLQEWQEL
jgi:hypothetical protein